MIAGSAALVTLVAVLALFTVFRSSSPAGGGNLHYAVGSPGIGQQAPDFTLAATTGQPIGLSSYRGHTVLLYFQEGLGCQPCWDQLTALESAAPQVRAAGVDKVLSITTGPVDLLKQKAHDEQLSTPILSDPDLTASRAYTANQYGMMGTSRDGHTFILVGPDGTIQWRADYGGQAGNYRMFVPVKDLLAQMQKARRS